MVKECDDGDARIVVGVGGPDGKGLVTPAVPLLLGSTPT